MNQIFQYHQNPVSFSRDDNQVMINATEMAKPFAKRPVDWLRLQSTVEFMEELSVVRNSANQLITEEKSTVWKSHSDDCQLVTTVNGGANPGTWMHEDVALEFARWLSPSFSIWCNDRIKELLKLGLTAINPEDLLNPEYMISVFTELKKERQERKVIEAEKELYKSITEHQTKQIVSAAPKVEYYDNVLQSHSSHLTTAIAKELGMSATALNKKLKLLGVQYKLNGVWMLYAKYQNLGYTTTRTYYFPDTHGINQSKMETVWTEKGRQFIHKLLNDNNLNSINKPVTNVNSNLKLQMV